MSDGIAWIGAHSAASSSLALPGMLGGISLTCARGIDADDFLIALGADLDELADRTLCRDLLVPARRPGDRSPHVNRAMHGTYGEWVYVLEDWGRRHGPPATGRWNRCGLLRTRRSSA